MRKILFALFAAFTVALFILTSFAHGGGTDYKGGHYKDNGDYHYHHGYPAHDHYDTDGDGIDDHCPYEHKDDTEHEQGAVTTTKKDTPFDIKKYIGSLFVAALVSFVPASLIFAVVVTAFKKYIPEKSETRVYVVVYVLTTIVISAII